MLRQSGDACEHADRVPHASPRHRSGVRQQAEGCGLERRESKPDQKGTGNSHGSAAAAGSFQKRAKAKCDQNQLQALVRRKARDGFLHHLKLSRFHSHVVQENRCDNDPRDPQEAEDEPKQRRAQDHQRRHPKDDKRQKDRHDHPAQSRNPNALLQHKQDEEERQHGQCGDQGREGPVAQRIVILVPRTQCVNSSPEVKQESRIQNPESRICIPRTAREFGTLLF